VTVKALLDCGGSGSLIAEKFTKKLRVQTKKNGTTWTTAAGQMRTDTMCKAQFVLPELYDDRLIEWDLHIAKSLGNYDMIIGQDLLTELGINILFQEQVVTWDDATIPMKDRDATMADSYFIKEEGAIDEATDRIKKILDAKYEKADLEEIAKQQTHLDETEQEQLKALLTKFEDLFDGTLGKWEDSAYNIELKPDAKPYHARAYPIPKAYEDTLKLEVERLCKVGVLKKVNRSEWAAPTFIIPKKDQTVRFISDFRELNKRIKRKPYPIPKIQDLLLKLEGFQYATSLDLNMGYYHIELSPFSKRLCTIVLPFGKYEYQRLPMGLCNSPDIFQEKMSELMTGLDYVRAYIDDLLCLTKGDFADHLNKLEVIFKRLQDAGLKINAKKSFFGHSELEYLGYWVTREGIQPVAKKVEAIKAIAEPKNKKELRRFIGIVNYYRDMWIRRSEVLAPLSALTSKEAKWQWTNKEQKSFETMKKIISRETLLAYPDFNKPFVVHTDASHTQLGAVISQDDKPIAFYSRKLNPAQTRYTTTERELLSIVETLKEFRNILLGQQIQVYTDHQNLTYKEFNTERVMRWRLLLEEFGPELIYIKGEHNIVADALSRLDLIPQKSEQTMNYLAENYGLNDEDLPADAFPLTYKQIAREQNKDKLLLEKVKTKADYHLKVFRGGGKKRELICKDNKIVLPSSIQRRCIEWYHTTLCHPGETRTEQTIRQHFYWKNMRDDVIRVCKTCDTCQRTKKNTGNINLGHLPEKVAEAEPWEILCVDLIGPYTFKRKGKKPYTLFCLTMIDPATGWFEMAEIKNKEAFTVAQKAETTWFTRYPWPQIVILDRGREFMAEFSKMIQNDYGVKKKPITARNPQANAIIERVHQTIGNIIRTFQVQDQELDENDPWSGILAATMFAIRATYHTTLQATPTQLVFGRDAILNVKYDANWKLIRDRKQSIIKKNNERENSKRKEYEYRVGQQVLVKTPQPTKYGSGDLYKGPYEILSISNDKATVRLRKGAVIQTYNIRNIKPYNVTE